LTPDGLLIISSPNKKIYSDLAGGDHNHFHVKELYFSELDALLGRYFSNVKYYGQRVTATSLLMPLERDLQDSIQTLTETDEGVNRATPASIEPMYYLAVASNIRLPDTGRTTAFFSECDNAFYEKQREVLDLSAEIRKMSEYIAEVSQALKVRDGDLDFIKQELATAQKDLKCAQTEIAILEDTRCARFTRTLRSFFGKA